MSKVTFNQIAGYAEEKKELQNICSLIKNRDDLYKIGGKLPKGIFLIGPNGVGKTALAKAFINESNCECVSINYNDLDNEEDFVNYIKSKFKEASEKTPCILFIDELDKLIGNNRHFFVPDNFDKSRVILNEINRYSDCEGLFLFVVANKEYHIDYSIVRSGRIDRVIEINLPNQQERKEIISYYSNGKTFDSSVDFKKLAKILHGFSGADIESLLNNAVIKSFTENRKEVTNDDIMSVYYDKVFNNNSKQQTIADSSLKYIAYHEAGHAVATLLKDPDSLTYATILSRGNIRGFVNQHEDETTVHTLDEKRNKILIAFGGIASEEVFFNLRTDGSASDIKRARGIATELVRYEGYCGFDSTSISIYVMDEMPPESQNSLGRLVRMEEKEDQLIIDCYKESKKLIEDNKNLVEEIAKSLLDKKVLNREDLERIFNTYKAK